MKKTRALSMIGLLSIFAFSVTCTSARKSFQDLRLSKAALESPAIYDLTAPSACAQLLGPDASSRIEGDRFTCVAPAMTGSTVPGKSAPRPIAELCGARDLDSVGSPTLNPKMAGQSEQCALKRICKAGFRRIFIHAMAGHATSLQETCMKCEDGEFDQKLTDEGRTSPEIQGSAGCDGSQFCAICRRPRD